MGFSTKTSKLDTIILCTQWAQDKLHVEQKKNVAKVFNKTYN